MQVAAVCQAVDNGVKNTEKTINIVKDAVRSESKTRILEHHQSRSGFEFFESKCYFKRGEAKNADALKRTVTRVIQRFVHQQECEQFNMFLADIEPSLDDLVSNDEYCALASWNRASGGGTITTISWKPGNFSGETFLFDIRFVNYKATFAKDYHIIERSKSNWRGSKTVQEIVYTDHMPTSKDQITAAMTAMLPAFALSNTSPEEIEDMLLKIKK